MTEKFITHIHIDSVRHVKDLDILLSNSQRKHLIITGKNGSGKTSLLDAIHHVFHTCDASRGRTYAGVYGPSLNSEILKSTGIELRLSSVDNMSSGYMMRHLYPFILIFFDAKRQANFSIPQGIQKVDLLNVSTLSQYFIQHIVNLKAERSFAKDDNDGQKVSEIDRWFDRFENCLKNLFDSEALTLLFDRKNYNFLISIPGQEPFSFSELSDGYSAVIRIITEIMLRMEAVQSSGYDVEGVVIIDEIETHLHVDLQKKILPFLCGFFPRIQFIVSTHSPFVLSSVENAVICDLQNRIVTEDLSGYSYDALIESYFKSDKYSDILKRKVARYEALADMPEKSDREMDEYFELKHELSNLPKYLAPELDVKLKQIELKHLS